MDSVYDLAKDDMRSAITMLIRQPETIRLTQYVKV